MFVLNALLPEGIARRVLLPHMLRGAVVKTGVDGLMEPLVPTLACSLCLSNSCPNISLVRNSSRAMTLVAFILDLWGADPVCRLPARGNMHFLTATSL